MFGYPARYRSGWIAAAAALVLAITGAVVCCDAADADGEERIDAREAFDSAIVIAGLLCYDEPSGYAQAISDTHRVIGTERYSELVLEDGASLRFSNSSKMYVENLFIDGSVEFVNADGSGCYLYAESVYLSGYRLPQSGMAFRTDGTVTVETEKTSTGFYDPATGKVDHSKRMEGSMGAVIETEGYLGISGGSSWKIRSVDGSPAAEILVEFELDEFYDNLKSNLDGLVLDESSMSKISAYALDRMVLPYIGIGARFAEVSDESSVMRNVTMTLSTVPDDGSVVAEVDVVSSTGALQCENLGIDIGFSLTDTRVACTADRLSVKSAGTSVASAQQGLELEKLSLSISSTGKDAVKAAIPAVMGGYRAVLDALSDSDAEISGTSVFSVESVKGSIPASGGEATTVTIDAQKLELASETDTATGSVVKGSASLLDIMTEGSRGSSRVKAVGVSEDLTTSGKNAFSALRLIRIDEENPSETDYAAAVLEYLDGLSVKGDVRLESLEMRSVYGTAGIDYSESVMNFTGSSGKNYQSKVDLGVATDKSTGRISVTGSVVPTFSGSAAGYGKTLVSDASGVKGGEITLKHIRVDAQKVEVDTTLKELSEGMSPADLGTMDVALSADVEKKSWSTGKGTAAYAEKITMRNASFRAELSDLMRLSSTNLPASYGDSLRIDSYSVSDRGTASMMEYDDVVAKADNSSSIKGSSYEFKSSGAGSESLLIADTETVIGGTDVKYGEVSDTVSVASLAKNEAGYYEVVENGGADSVPVYNIESKAPAKSGDNTLLYVVIAIIALILIALVARSMLRKRTA